MGARPWRCPSDPATAIKRFIKNTLPPCHHCTHTMHVAWQSIVCKGRAGPDHDWQRSRPTLNGASGVPIARKIVAAACLRRKDPCHGGTPPGPLGSWRLTLAPPTGSAVRPSPYLPAPSRPLLIGLEMRTFARRSVCSVACIERTPRTHACAACVDRRSHDTDVHPGDSTLAVCCARHLTRRDLPVLGCPSSAVSMRSKQSRAGQDTFPGEPSRPRLCVAT